MSVWWLHVGVVPVHLIGLTFDPVVAGALAWKEVAVQQRGGCLSIKMYSHLFHFVPLHCDEQPPLLCHPYWLQSTMRKEVADSNLYECQP
jgi:hypothetical protein